jgi:hypothetical protein
MKYHLAISIVTMQLMTSIVGFPLSSIAESDLFTKVSPSTLSTQDLVQIAPRSQKTDNLVDFPEVGLAIRQPNGFTKATSFYGFEQAETKSSVMLSKIPGPFAEVTKGFNKSTLATRGIDLISKKAVKIDNQSGFLLNVSQSAYGQTFRKWILVFGNAQSTNVMTATFPSTNTAKLSDSLKQLILAVRPIAVSAPTASSLPFTVTTVAGLLPVQKIAAVGKAAAFTKDGNIPTAEPTDPLLIVAPSLGTFIISDTKAYATKRLSGYPQFEIGTVTSTNEISIDNLPGWEIIVDARDRQTQAALKIYQIMLFPRSGGYVSITGIVGDKQAEVYLPKFKAIALTYRNSPK